MQAVSRCTFGRSDKCCMLHYRLPVQARLSPLTPRSKIPHPSLLLFCSFRSPFFSFLFLSALSPFLFRVFPLNQLGGLSSAVSSFSGVWSRAKPPPPLMFWNILCGPEKNAQRSKLERMLTSLSLKGRKKTFPTFMMDHLLQRLYGADVSVCLSVCLCHGVSIYTVFQKK